MEKAVVDPSTLVFREGMQNRLDSVRARFAGDGYSPITAIDTQDGVVILDGHNRAMVAQERGHNLPVVILSQAEYDYLVGMGYDDMEISYAALTAVDEIDAAMAYVDQFAGSNIFERGEEAYSKLMEIAQ